MNINGYSIHVSPLCSRQRVMVSSSFEWITDEYREKLNSELMEMFGAEEVIICDDIEHRIFTGPRTYKKLLAASKLHGG